MAACAAKTKLVTNQRLGYASRNELRAYVYPQKSLDQITSGKLITVVSTDSGPCPTEVDHRLAKPINPHLNGMQMTRAK